MKTITIQAVSDPETDEIYGIEIIREDGFYFVARDQDLWPGCRAGKFPERSPEDLPWDKNMVLLAFRPLEVGLDLTEAALSVKVSL